MRKPRRRRKHGKGLKYFAAIVALVVLCAAAFWYLKRAEIAPPPVPKGAAGYKMEDRLQLEKLINQGAKSD